ncbi:MAG: aldehyde dehydrogenase family protein [Clostridiaceae bacterium]|nr:aldehyde dehydrogenase family protein [Clostridiaceae bacterium]
MTKQWQEIIHRQKARASCVADRLERSRSALLKLKRMIVENEQDFIDALHSDLGKSPVEAYASEIALTLNEIDYLLKNHRRFLKNRRAICRPGTTAIVSRRPYGSVLIMSPWNYPFQLALLPLAGALAAGNSCFLKPSELAPATSGLISRLVADVFSPDDVCVVEGDGSVAAELLSQNWDFIFFTGSERVGSIIAEQAARLRIPCILELGGKCPCIVDAESVNEVTARRIIWGKFFNAGQTCVAPDHLYVEASALPALLEELKNQLRLLYGPDHLLSDDYGRIIGRKHFDRLLSMLSDGTVYLGGSYQTDQLYIEPTIITEPDLNSALMQEEIFGPLLPIITWSDQDQLMHDLQSRPAPLVVYAFCRDKHLINRLQDELISGAFCLNNVLEHVARAELPFGGVGNSGYGRYHGKASIDAFTWQKTIYKKSQSFDLRLKYPPYENKHLKMVRIIRRWLP